MRRIVTVLALASAVVLVSASAATAERPEFNPACEGVKIDPVESGTYAVPFGDAPGSITIVVRETDDGPVFDFVTDDPAHLVTSIVVKGGPAAVEYTPNASEGTGLHAALNPSSGEWYGLSHLCISTELADGGGGEEEGGGAE